MAAVLPARRSKRALAAAALVASCWVLVSAQDSDQREVSWGRAREAAAGGYRTITDGSGLVEVDSDFPLDIDAEDLNAVCRAQDRAIARATTRAQLAMRSFGIDDDPGTSARRAMVGYRLAAIATYQGRLDQAIEHLAGSRDALTPYAADYAELVTRPLLVIEETLGVAHLRRGEVENCLLMPNAERCLFPVLAGGRHDRKAGASAAVERFQAYLAKAPDDLEVTWLLNVAYMLLDRYPDGVPTEHLLEPGLFASSYDMPRFRDVAGGVGMGQMDIAGGTIADDLDRDGLVDVLLTSVDKCRPARLYRNAGDGTFEDRTEAAGLATQYGAINSVQTDYDNDGLIDLFLLRGGWEIPIRNSLLRNNGDGTFTDVTMAAGLGGAHPTHSAAWADFDNDGWLDVFVAHELTKSQMFRNRGDGTFEDVTTRAGVASLALTKGVVAGDYDGDGWPDLYLSNMFDRNFLFRNNGDGTFTEVAEQAGVAMPELSFPTWFFDYDNDGRLDLFVASYPNSLTEFVKHYVGEPALAETLTLYRNRGDGTFENVSKAVGLDRVVPAMGANYGDLDNDGYLDMYLGTGTPSFASLMPNIMLRNDAGRRFVDVTASTGTGHLQKGHGVAFVDLDNDGDEDVVINLGGAVPGDSYTEAVFENPGAGDGHRWISVRLVGAKSNRAGIGAKIRVNLKEAGGRPGLRFREVTSGGSFGSNSLTQHIGLGRATIESLEIEWPTSGTTQTFRDVPVDSFLEIREGVERFEVLTPPVVKLRSAAPASHQH